MNYTLDEVLPLVSPEIGEQLKKRIETGKKEYGQALNNQTDIDPVQHLLEELLDGVLYAQRAIQDKHFPEQYTQIRDNLVSLIGLVLMLQDLPTQPM